MKTLHTRRTRLIAAVLAALAMGTSLSSAQAAVFKDAQLESQLAKLYVTVPA